MSDPTEPYRRDRVARLNQVAAENANEALSAGVDPEVAERKRLEALYGQVWDTQQLSEDFLPLGFMAPYIVVKRKSDGSKGSLEFQHHPRFYFNFQES